MVVSTISAEVQNRVTSDSTRFWTPEDFADLDSGAAVLQALSRMAAAGDLRRISKGVYWRGALIEGFESLGMSPPPPASQIPVICKITSGYGPTGAWAANVLAMSTQIPRQEWFAIPKRAPTHPLHGLRFVSRPARLGRLEQQLNQAEVAVLETLGDRRWVEVSEADMDAIVVGLAERGVIRADRMLAASATEPYAVREAVQRLLASY